VIDCGFVSNLAATRCLNSAKDKVGSSAIPRVSPSRWAFTRIFVSYHAAPLARAVTFLLVIALGGGGADSADRGGPPASFQLRGRC